MTYGKAKCDRRFFYNPPVNTECETMKRFFDQIKRLSANQDFIRPLITIGLPVALQNLIAASLNMVDTLMIGRLGPVEIAAVGLANQFFFLLNLFLFGVNSGAAIFTAQFWGERDVKNIRRVLGISLLTGMMTAFLFFLMAVLFPEWILGAFSSDPRVIATGSEYLRIVALGYIPMAVSFCFAFLLRSTGEVILPVTVSMSALITNSVLNYLLIYGNAGLPRMGVPGAAWATVFARVLEMTILLFLVYQRRLPLAANRRELMDITPTFVRRFFNTTVPVILNEFLWALGVTMFTIVYARMGTHVVAAVNIFSTVERMSMVFIFGLAQACAVTLGHMIGSGRETEAKGYAQKYALLGPMLGLFIAGLLTVVSGPVLSLFNVPDSVTTNAAAILSIFAVILPVKIFNLVNIVGVLRSGGDTKFSLLLDTVGLWVIAVPLAFLAGFVWRLPPPLVYLLVNMEEVFKCGLGIYRLVSGKWLNNLTHTMRKALEPTG